MTLYELVQREAGPRFRMMVGAAVLTGAANGLVLTVVNAEARGTSQSSLGSFLVFVAAMLLFGASARYLYRETAELLEGVLDRLKVRIADKLLRADLRTLERLDAAEIYERVTQNTTVIANAAGHVAHVLQLAFIAAFGALYVASVSLAAFVLVVFVMGVGIALFKTRSAEVKAHLRAASKARVGFFERLNDLLHGFKEVKLRASRGEDLRADIARAADEVRAISVEADVLFAEKHVFGRFNFFALLAAVVLLLPQYVPDAVASPPQLLAAVLFSYSPINGILSGLPTVTRADVALEQIEALERKLDRALRPDTPTAVDPWAGRFETIALQAVELRYGDSGEDLFRLGPISLEIPRGQLLFIVGGNGSGKSTLLRLLTGLYLPGAGALRVDGIELVEENVQAYREMIAAVYADFHLFKRLYGLADTKPEDVRRMLERLRIAHKTSFAGGQFSTLALSTGQRKRLAMAVALLEDRSIYAFDEWAADQDPEFRQYFYEELLPELKRRGKTLFVVTHDDRYFHLADRVLILDNGTLRSAVAEDS